MCLAVPMKLIERQEALGIAELDGVRREVSLMLQP
jgi:hydrogenase maturation factor